MILTPKMADLTHRRNQIHWYSLFGQRIDKRRGRRRMPTTSCVLEISDVQSGIVIHLRVPHRIQFVRSEDWSACQKPMPEDGEVEKARWIWSIRRGQRRNTSSASCAVRTSCVRKCLTTFYDPRVSPCFISLFGRSLIQSRASLV